MVTRLVLHHPKGGGTELLPTIFDNLNSLRPLVVGNRPAESDHEIRRSGPGPLVIASTPIPAVHIHRPGQPRHQSRDRIGHPGHRRAVLILDRLQRRLGPQRVLQFSNLLRTQRALLLTTTPKTTRTTGTTSQHQHTNQRQQPHQPPPHQYPPSHRCGKRRQAPSGNRLWGRRWAGCVGFTDPAVRLRRER